MSKILLCGNPNVGKSTIYNYLTSSYEHTGNWSGKTVEIVGKEINNSTDVLVDLPGVYSLTSLSEEEVITRNTLLFEEYDKIIYVFDALNIERNLNLLLQILEINSNVIICVNMMDELERKGISLDIGLLSMRLGCDIITCSYSDRDKVFDLVTNNNYCKYNIKFSDIVDEHINNIMFMLDDMFSNRFIALKILEGDTRLINDINSIYGVNLINNEISDYLRNINFEELNELINISRNLICKDIVRGVYSKKERVVNKFDKLLSNKFIFIGIMFFVLFFVFFLTIKVANYPSSILSALFAELENILYAICLKIHIPSFIYSPLLFGVYRVVSFIVSVMFPPTVIFFFLFTLAEEAGFLPRLAFNSDSLFRKCGCHGKQSLTMCSGFGCNACAVVSSRIIDSKKDRLISIITNSFIPCNGRFPMIIALISMFFVNSSNKLLVSLYLTLFIIFSMIISLVVSYFLSKTLLKGESGFFILEIPEYRKVSVINVFKSSFFNKALSTLKKAILVSIPAGIIIYLFNNFYINGSSVYLIMSNLLEPFSKLIGLDGVILLAFILGIPANEIVLPLIVMGYLGNGQLEIINDYISIKSILVEHGWNIQIAFSVILFSIMHYPCATTLSTIKNEVGIKWTIVSFFVPLITGIIFLLIFNFIA